MRYLGNCATHLLARCHVLRTIKCHASPIDRPIRDPARAYTHTHTCRNFALFSLYFSFLFIYSLFLLHIFIFHQPTRLYIDRAYLYRIARAHTYTLACSHAPTHTHTRNIISARDDPTFLRLHVGLRMPSVRNTSVQCHVINRTNRCRTDRNVHTFHRRPLCLQFLTQRSSIVYFEKHNIQRI